MMIIVVYNIGIGNCTKILALMLGAVLAAIERGLAPMLFAYQYSCIPSMDPVTVR